jgi:exonuclease SbcD
VLVVDAEPGRPPVVESVALSAGRRLRDVEGTLEQLSGLAGEVGTDFLRVGVRVDAPVPGVAEQVKQMLPGVLEVRLLYESSPTATSAPSRDALDPAELFSEFYTRKHGAAPARPLTELFRAIYDEAAQR